MSVLFTHRYLAEGGSGVALMDPTSPSATIGPQREEVVEREHGTDGC